MIRKIALLATMLPICTLVLTGCSGCGEDFQNALYKSAIEKVMHDTTLTGSMATQEKVDSLKGIDLSSCPMEFREAYIRYTHAWEEEVAVSDARAKLKSREDTDLLAGGFATLFNSSETPWADHEKAGVQIEAYGKRADADLQSTAQQLDDIARKYGVQLQH